MKTLLGLVAPVLGFVGVMASAGTARAHCIDPAECICGDDPVTILEGEIDETDDGRAAVQVATIHGAPRDYTEGDVVVLEDILDPPSVGTHVLIYLGDENALGDLREVGDDGILECDQVKETTVQEAVALALGDDCLVEASELTIPFECDDTPTCSVGKGRSAAPLLLLTLLGLLRRRA